MRPDTTGETAKGKSIRVIRRLLPTNSNLASTHAADTPNTRFSGTAMPAASSVKRMAASASGSLKLAKYVATPFWSAVANTTASGMNRNSPRKSAATPIRSQRTTADSVVARIPVSTRAAVRVFNVVVPAISNSCAESAFLGQHARMHEHLGSLRTQRATRPEPFAAPLLQQIDRQQQRE